MSNLSSDEFKQFEKRIDERHEEDKRRHQEIMNAFSDLPCKLHQEQLDSLKQSRASTFGWLAGVAAAGGFVGWCIEVLLGIPHVDKIIKK